MNDASSLYDTDPENLNRLLLQIMDEEEEGEDTGTLKKAEHISPQLGSRIDRYRLVQVLGEGGMGLVYLAQQDRPIRRQVALKVIKPGMDSRRVMVRFEAERQVLAQLDHPNIAHVYDAGTTETGLPYFVMEYVEGLSITKYCDHHELTIEDRLNLFLPICQGVFHAHQKGIIHRDIKPSNILVSEQETQAVPKIIDFGVAKAIHQSLTEQTCFTADSQLLGTPEYMSPEQVDMANDDIDTRSDIYSLGVLLYVLLTGVLPFDTESFHKGGFDKLRKLLCETDPKTPSTRLSKLGAEAREIAKKRQTEVALLTRRLHQELEWIPLKAMRKERSERYHSVSELADDVRNYLAGKPLRAGPESRWYRCQKFVHRYRLPVATLGFAVVVLVIGFIVSTSLYVQVRRSQKTVSRLETQAETDRLLSSAQDLHDQGRYASARNEMEAILHRGDAGPQADLFHARLLFEVGDYSEATKKLEGMTTAKADVAGAAHALLARIYLGTDPNRVQAHQQEAERLLAETQGADAFWFRSVVASNPEESLQWLSEALKEDPGHYASRKVRALTHYGLREFDLMAREAEFLIVLRPKDPLAHALHAVALRELRELDQAIERLNQAIQLCDIETERVQLFSYRHQIHCEAGNYEQALADARHCVEMQPDEALYRFHTFHVLMALADYDRAQDEYQAVVALGPQSERQFTQWGQKLIFDTLTAEKPLQLPDPRLQSPAFWPLYDAVDYWYMLKAKATPAIGAGITLAWSPDGNQLAYGRRSEHVMWVPPPWCVPTVGSNLPQLRSIEGMDLSANGIAILDLSSSKTQLLTRFGHNPRWSPTGEYIAFTRSTQNHTDDEVWIVPVEGGPARYLTKGWAIAWSRDAQCLYYRCRTEIGRSIYRLSAVNPTAKPRYISRCGRLYPAISPDEKYLAQFLGADLCITDLSSGSRVVRWRAPVEGDNLVLEWSPDSRELSVGSIESPHIGLWIYDLASQRARQIFEGPIARAIRSPGGRHLAFELRATYNEIWLAPIDPDDPIIEAFGPGLTLEAYYEHHAEEFLRRIESDTFDHNSSWRAKLPADLARCGVERYHQGDFEKALETLTRVERLRSALRMELFPTEAAFLAMSLHQLDRDREAQLVFDRFQGSMEGYPEEVRDFILAVPEPVPPPANGANDTQESCISQDGLELYISRMELPGGHGRQDLWVHRRESLHSNWGEPSNLGPNINGPEGETEPALSPNGLEICFRRYRPRPGFDLMVSVRKTKSDPWLPARTLGLEINDPNGKGYAPYFSATGLELYFSANRPAGYGKGDLYVAKRRSQDDDAWRPAKNLGPSVNSLNKEGCPCITNDGLTLYFTANRNSDGCGHLDTWVSTRISTEDDWRKPINLGPQINSSTWDYGPTISPDGSTLYFDSHRAGGYGADDIWQVTRVPLIDVDGDGQFTTEDLCLLVENQQE